MHPLKSLFPNAMTVSHPSNTNEFHYIPIANHQWFAIPKHMLTIREQALLDYVLHPEIALQQHYSTEEAWRRYVFGEQSYSPQKTQSIHGLYIHIQPHKIQDFSASAWCETLKSLFTNGAFVFPLHPSLYLLLFTDAMIEEEFNQFSNILPTLEEDFSIQMSIGYGHYWTINEATPEMIQTEINLVSAYMQSTQKTKTIAFAEMVLWGMIKGQLDLDNLLNELYQQLTSQEYAVELIQALWKEQGNLSKTSQRLYLHRNTLHYRLDKLYELTHLSLKDRNQLALAYFMIQKFHY